MTRRTIILIVVLIVVWVFVIIYLVNYFKPKPVTPVKSQEPTSQAKDKQLNTQGNQVNNFEKVRARIEEERSIEENLKSTFKEALKPYVLILDEGLLATNSPIDATNDKFYYLGYLKMNDRLKIYVFNGDKEDFFYTNELYKGKYRTITANSSYIILFDLEEGNIKKLAYKYQ